MSGSGVGSTLEAKFFILSTPGTAILLGNGSELNDLKVLGSGVEAWLLEMRHLKRRIARSCNHVSTVRSRMIIQAPTTNNMLLILRVKAWFNSISLGASMMVVQFSSVLSSGSLPSQVTQG